MLEKGHAKMKMKSMTVLAAVAALAAIAAHGLAAPLADYPG